MRVVDGCARSGQRARAGGLRSQARNFLLPLPLMLAGCERPDAVTSPGDGRPMFVQISGDRYWTEWSEYEAGGQPEGFVQAWDPSPHFKVVIDSARMKKVLEWSAPTIQNRNRFGFAYAGAGEMSDQSVYTEVRVRALVGSSGPFYLGTAAVRITGSAINEGGYALWLFANGPSRSVTLATFNNGAYLQLADYPLSWSNDTWYSVRLEAIGTTIRAKIWARGTAEPPGWQIERTHSGWSEGKPGVANHDNAIVQWDLWEARGTVTVPPPPPVLKRIVLQPDSITVIAGGTATFSARGLRSDGSTIAVPVSYTATGGTITAAGIYTAGFAAGTYRVIAIHEGSPALADTSVVKVITPPPALVKVIDFTGETIGTQPAGWSETAYPNNSSWAIASDAGVSDARILRNVTTATGRHILRLDAVSDTTTAQEIVVRMRMGDGDGRGPGIALRHTMNGSLESAYVAYLRSSGTVEVNRFVNGNWAFIGEAAFPNQPGKWYWIRFRAEGNTLRLKVWNDDVLELDDWTRHFTDSSLAAGSAGLYTYEPNIVDYDGVGFAAGGATAPVPTNGHSYIPVLHRIKITPATLSLTEGRFKQFEVYGRWSDGDSTAVPVTWQATGGSITTNGLFMAGSVPGTYHVIATHMTRPLADTATVTITAAPPAPPAGWMYSTGFTTDPEGQFPAGWSATAYPANSTWMVVADNTASDGRVLRNKVTGTGRHILRFDGVLDTTSTQEVLVKMRMGDADNRGPGIALRHRMNGTKETAYVAYLRSGSNVIEINRFLDGQWTFIADAPFVNAPGVWYWIRFRAEGTTLLVKAWADGSAEPGTWLHMASDAGISTGSVGLYTYEANTVDYDHFGVAAGGAAALRWSPNIMSTISQGHK